MCLWWCFHTACGCCHLTGWGLTLKIKEKLQIESQHSSLLPEYGYSMPCCLMLQLPWPLHHGWLCLQTVSQNELSLPCQMFCQGMKKVSSDNGFWRCYLHVQTWKVVDTAASQSGLSQACLWSPWFSHLKREKHAATCCQRYSTAPGKYKNSINNGFSFLLFVNLLFSLRWHLGKVAHCSIIYKSQNPDNRN